MRAALRFAPAVFAGGAAASLLASEPARTPPPPDAATSTFELPSAPPRPAVEAALAAAVKAKLSSLSTPTLPCSLRFGDAELTRHALHTGLHTASSPVAADAAATAAAARVAASAAWWRARRDAFLSPHDVETTWSPYVRWAPCPDGSGRPVLVVRAGAAARSAIAPTAPPGRRAPDFANAVVSSCESFVTANVDVGALAAADTLVVVIDAGGAGPAAAARSATTILDLARTFAAHYPARLASLVVTNAPWAVTVPLALVERAAHATTARKIRLARCAEDLPPGAAATLAAMERDEEERE